APGAWWSGHETVGFQSHHGDSHTSVHVPTGRTRGGLPTAVSSRPKRRTIQYRRGISGGRDQAADGRQPLLPQVGVTGPASGVDDVTDALQGDRPGSGAVGDGERGLLGHWGTILHVCAPPGFPRGREKSSARTRVQWFRTSGRRTGNPGWEPPIADSRVVACGAWRVVGQRSIPRKRLSDDNTDTPHGPSGRRPRRSCEPE